MVSTVSSPEARRLLQALALFEQTFGKSTSKLTSQAILGAIAAVMDDLELAGHDLDDTVHQLVHLYQQVDGQLDNVDSPGELAAALGQQALDGIVQAAHHRLEDTKETLTQVTRIYLQRVSAQLSAQEFVELAKTAIGLVSQERQLSGAEGKYLLYGLLQTFGAKLSQPIPAFGERTPQGILDLVRRLIRYQKMIHTHGGLESALTTLVVKTLKNSVQHLSPGLIRSILANSTLAIDANVQTEDDLGDLAHTMFFKLQFQPSVAAARKSSQEIMAQLDQAITTFQEHYQPVDVTQPVWTDDLSISSPMVNSLGVGGADCDRTTPASAPRHPWSPRDSAHESSNTDTTP